jgi:large subunit ribosomal protein L3
MEKLPIKFLLGEKLGMTQVFEDGLCLPVTIIKAGPCVVTNIKIMEKDGYNAIQLGYGYKKSITKPEFGQVHKLGRFKLIKEFRLPELPELNIGDKLNVDIFQKGELINISGHVKAKGFQGVVKRHGFRDGPRTHGQKDRYRHPGSIGGTNPQKVIKGLRMAGRMGPKRITVKNLEIVDIIPEENLMLVKGSVPGKKGEILEIRSAYLTNKGKILLLEKVKKALARA